ncbi:hypothetical protein PHYPO_G00090340 [Pangasianodon hypophthalmus]|uniref:Uncharacterized protein n=2 Tax=Pangasianodon TaxID=30992 RepID=A0A5N5LHZ3_PANHP|nr:hypothetical protein PHYPO_G00090340 [Pangasianodon hypophthalmus]MCI4389146.1 hypothetical protein [Pangasianodon gigas]
MTSPLDLETETRTENAEATLTESAPSKTVQLQHHYYLTVLDVPSPTTPFTDGPVIGVFSSIQDKHKSEFRCTDGYFSRPGVSRGLIALPCVSRGDAHS